MTSREAAEAAAQALCEYDPHAEVVSIPVSDGGEGMLEAYLAACPGSLRTITVRSPLGAPIAASYGVTDDGLALIETAQAVGLHLIPPPQRNPLLATSYGVGQLIADAVERGYRDFVVGLGGTATCDGGVGMMEALTRQLGWDGDYASLYEGALAGCRFRLASDVRNPLCGPEGAARVFAPQKGAKPRMVEEIEARLVRLSSEAAVRCGYDRSRESGAGAAGGLGYALMQFLRATCVSGVDLLLDLAHFDMLLQGADLVITGEGRADRQTLMGKLPYGILERASARSVPTWLLAGSIGDEDLLKEAGYDRVASINPPGAPLEEAMRKEVAQARLRETLLMLLDGLSRAGREG